MKVYFVRRKKYVVKLWFVVGSCPFCFTSKISDPSSGKRGLKSVFSDFLLFYSGQLSPHLATAQKRQRKWAAILFPSDSQPIICQSVVPSTYAVLLSPDLCSSPARFPLHPGSVFTRHFAGFSFLSGSMYH